MIRGRGATPQTIDSVDTKAKNLFGRQILKVRYRRLSTWSDEQVAIAERILVHYFMKLGAFQTINDAAVRVVINRLVDGMTEEHAIWAINAKLASLGETHAEKLKTLNSIPGVVPSPQRFFEGHLFESWLDRSPEMRAQIAEANRAAAQRRAADPAVQAKTKQQHAAAAAATDTYQERRRKAADREREIKERWRQREGGAS